jgi:hypothetical protein
MTYEVLQIVVSVAAALITAFLLPWLKAKIGEESWARLVEVVRVAVRAAEKAYEDEENNLVRQTAKYEYVLSFLAEKGIDLSESELDALVNSAVQELDQ